MDGAMQQSRLSPRGPFTGSHMLNVKNARLRSEHDVNLLKNRLERLRQEERKALKKIEETRRRADQIISLKTRNEENHMRKLLEAEYANKQLERARARLQGHREGMQDAIRMNTETLLQQKKEEADVLRDQSRRISEHVRQQQAQHVDRARRINSVRVLFPPGRPLDQDCVASAARVFRRAIVSPCVAARPLRRTIRRAHRR